jgi:tetratricopeptide (TPR) repeat protein
MVSKSLEHFPTAGRLWYIKALFHLDKGHVSDANAALKMAQGHKAASHDIRYARGLIFTEWRRYVEAIAELCEVLDSPLLSQANIARARGTLAFALFRNSQVSEAMTEFDDMEKEEADNAWLHYFRARCYELQAAEVYSLAQTDGDPMASIDGDGYCEKIKYKQLMHEDKALERYERALECDRPPLSRPKREEVKRSVRFWLESMEEAKRS